MPLRFTTVFERHTGTAPCRLHRVFRRRRTHNIHNPRDSHEYQDVPIEESGEEPTTGTAFRCICWGIITFTLFLLAMLSVAILVDMHCTLMEKEWLCRQLGYTHLVEIIQGHSPLQPGHCWCFPGDRGHFAISLSHPTSITHVTIGHISKHLSPYGNIASAPREFTIYGTRCDNQNIKLARLVYDQDGPSLQTFEVPDQDKGVFSHVKLQIDSNWGNIWTTTILLSGQSP